MANNKAMQRGLGGFPAEPSAQIVVEDDWDAKRPQCVKRVPQLETTAEGDLAI